VERLGRLRRVKISRQIMRNRSGLVRRRGLRQSANMTNQSPNSPFDLRFETFEPLQGSSFICRGEEGGSQLVLSEVKGLENLLPDAETRSPFVLLFRSSSREVLPQGVYELASSALGEVAIFLVPVARDEGGVSYEAVFN
jgi:hypothetical protein